MIAPQQYFWDRMPFKFSRPRELRVLQHPVSARERIVKVAEFVAKYARDHSHQCVNQHHSGHLTTIEDVVTDGDFQGLEDV